MRFFLASIDLKYECCGKHLTRVDQRPQYIDKRIVASMYSDISDKKLFSNELD